MFNSYRLYVVYSNHSASLTYTGNLLTQSSNLFHQKKGRIIYFTKEDTKDQN